MALSGDAKLFAGAALASKYGSDRTLLSAELALAFADSANASLASLTALRDAVCVYVETESERGSSLDVITTNLGAILHRARMSGSADRRRDFAIRAQDDALVKNILSWCPEFFPTTA